MNPLPEGKPWGKLLNEISELLWWVRQIDSDQISVIFHSMSDSSNSSAQRQSASASAPVADHGAEPARSSDAAACSPGFISSGEPPCSENEASSALSKAGPLVIQTGDPVQSELEFLHLLEYCGTTRGLLAQTESSRRRMEKMLCLWKSLGRPSPANMLSDVNSGICPRLVGLVVWSSVLWEKFKNLSSERQSASASVPVADNGTEQARSSDAAACSLSSLSAESPEVKLIFRKIGDMLAKGFSIMGQETVVHHHKIAGNCAFSLRTAGISVIVGLRGALKEENFNSALFEAGLDGSLTWPSVNPAVLKEYGAPAYPEAQSGRIKDRVVDTGVQFVSGVETSDEGATIAGGGDYPVGSHGGCDSSNSSNERQSDGTTISGCHPQPVQPLSPNP
jgi:hypothetical protein